MRVSRLRLERNRWKFKRGEKGQERKDGQIRLLLRKAALRFTSKDNESATGVIKTNRSILEGRG